MEGSLSLNSGIVKGSDTVVFNTVYFGPWSNVGQSLSPDSQMLGSRMLELEEGGGFLLLEPRLPVSR